MTIAPASPTFRDAGSTPVEDLHRTLAEDGIVLLSNIRNRSHLLGLAEGLGTIRPHRDSERDGVTVVAPRQEQGNAGLAGFSDGGLFPHTDRSISKIPPLLVLLWCQEPASKGGDTLLADGKRVYEQLEQFEPVAFHAVTAPNSAVFSSDGEFLLGSVFEQIRGNRVSLRFRFDKLFFMTQELAEAMPIVRGAMTASTMAIRLKKGEAYIVQNTRWLHGRRPFSGHRVYGRVHVDPPPNLFPSFHGFTPARSKAFA